MRFNPPPRTNIMLHLAFLLATKVPAICSKDTRNYLFSRISAHDYNSLHSIHIALQNRAVHALLPSSQGSFDMSLFTTNCRIYAGQPPAKAHQMVELFPVSDSVQSVHSQLWQRQGCCIRVAVFGEVWCLVRCDGRR